MEDTALNNNTFHCLAFFLILSSQKASHIGKRWTVPQKERKGINMASFPCMKRLDKSTIHFYIFVKDPKKFRYMLFSVLLCSISFNNSDK